MPKESSHFSLARGTKKCHKKVRFSHLRRVREMPSLNFSLAPGHTFHLLGSEKCQKKVCTFYLHGVQKNAKEGSLFSLAAGPREMPYLNFSLARGHIFHLQGSEKMPKERLHLSLAGGPRKCQKKVHTLHLQVV